MSLFPLRGYSARSRNGRDCNCGQCFSAQSQTPQKAAHCQHVRAGATIRSMSGLVARNASWHRACERAANRNSAARVHAYHSSTE